MRPVSVPDGARLRLPQAFLGYLARRGGLCSIESRPSLRPDNAVSLQPVIGLKRHHAAPGDLSEQPILSPSVIAEERQVLLQHHHRSARRLIAHAQCRHVPVGNIRPGPDAGKPKLGFIFPSEQSDCFGLVRSVDDPAGVHEVGFRLCQVIPELAPGKPALQRTHHQNARRNLRLHHNIRL